MFRLLYFLRDSGYISGVWNFFKDPFAYKDNILATFQNATVGQWIFFGVMTALVVILVVLSEWNNKTEKKYSKQPMRWDEYYDNKKHIQSKIVFSNVLFIYAFLFVIGAFFDLHMYDGGNDMLGTALCGGLIIIWGALYRLSVQDMIVQSRKDEDWLFSHHVLEGSETQQTQQ